MQLINIASFLSMQVEFVGFAVYISSFVAIALYFIWILCSMDGWFLEINMNYLDRHGIAKLISS